MKLLFDFFPVLLFFIAAQLGLNASDHFLHHGLSISASASLIVVLVVLAMGILASFIFPGKAEEKEAEATDNV